MRLQEIRVAKGLTQKQVADAIGCIPSVYSRYETGQREPSLEILVQLAKFFGVSLDELVGYETPTTQGLSSYEVALVNAAREADERAREDALTMLQAHRVGKKKENLA
jgi:transcriptional regulator with XRE-family HTH domain